MRVHRAMLIAQAGGSVFDRAVTTSARYFDLPPITENIGKVTRVLEDEADAIRDRD